MRRRQFITYGFVGGIGLAVGGFALSMQRGRSGKAATLGAREMGTLMALAEAMHPGGAGLKSAADLGVSARVDALMGSINPDLSDEFRLVLRLIEQPVVGLLFDGAYKPFSARSLAQRQADLDAWRRSRFPLRRAAAKSAIALVNSLYWGDPRNRHRVAYPGPPAIGALDGR